MRIKPKLTIVAMGLILTGCSTLDTATLNSARSFAEDVGGQWVAYSEADTGLTPQEVELRRSRVRNQIDMLDAAIGGNQ